MEGEAPAEPARQEPRPPSGPTESAGWRFPPPRRRGTLMSAFDGTTATRTCTVGKELAVTAVRCTVVFTLSLICARGFAEEPKTAREYYDRGVAYASEQAFDEALADFSDAIRLDPKMTDALKARAHVFGAREQ